MGRKGRAVVMVVVVALAAPLEGAAFAAAPVCEPRGVIPGDRVRVAWDFRSEPIAGRVVAVGEKGLVLSFPNEPAPRHISWCSLLRLDVWSGTRPRTRAGAKIGALFPGIPLGLLGMAYMAIGNIDCDTDCRVWPVLAAGAIGVGAGAGIGAAIGSQVRMDLWKPAPRVEVGLSLAPRRGGIATGLSVSF